MTLVHAVVVIGRFYTKDALSVWTNLDKYFVVRLGYASRRTTFRSASFKTYFEGKFVQMHSASRARLYT